MGDGYVLNFSNASFAQFIALQVDRDIWADRYQYGSGSKANLLRGFWTVEDDATVGRLLADFLEFIETQIALEHLNADQFKPVVIRESQRIVRRLLGDQIPTTSVLAEDPEMLEEFL